MIPIQAQLHYKEEVKYDPDNPLHRPYLGEEMALEDRAVDGVITDILVTDDVVTQKIQDGVQNGKNTYRDVPVNVSGIYVVFWEDKGDHYTMRVENYNRITVSKKEMRNYVSTTRNV